MRHSRTAAIVLVALAAALGGCGGSSSTAAPGGFTYQKTLTIYSDLPLQGPQGALMTSIVYGEKLALYQAGGRVGKTPISFASLNDAQASADGWTYVQTGASARAAPVTQRMKSGMIEAKALRMDTSQSAPGRRRVQLPGPS